MVDAATSGGPRPADRPDLPAGLAAAIAAAIPGATVTGCEPLGGDAGHGASEKGGGYGRPLRVRLRDAAGRERSLVLRSAGANEFGHDRRADRAAQVLLAWDTFPLLPDHVQALDVGALTPAGLLSLREAGELYLLTDYAEGTPYAEDLRRVVATGEATALDLDRAAALARWLGALHAERIDDVVAWRRAVRDLLGSGEGIFGIVDAYPPGTVPAAALHDLERACLDWRWRLRSQPRRLRRIHGDFHPFNLLFGEGVAFTALDASRGCAGDPADDLTALAVNYVFFALERPSSWLRGFGPLWRRFWEAYGEVGDLRAALAAAPPFLAWRALVVGCPRFYPRLPATSRSALLWLAERALAADRLDLALPEELLGCPAR
jgi:aminoglycoside phosphotransferase (APT) family kinase protein